MPDFPVLEVQPDEVISDEAMGSKTKFWFRRGEQRWLFKEARGGTGEDWAEKIASEIAHQLDVRAATVELAIYEGRPGCASLTFANREKGDALTHGNEILAGMVLGYERDKKFHQSDHTIENILAAIRSMFPNDELCKASLTTLAGYLVLDALIGNTDRHHENWALLRKAPELVLDVAPTFDHASSLGRELQDARRQALLQNGRIGEYVRRGKGAIYLRKGDAYGENPLRLVEYGTQQYAEYFLPTLRRLPRVAPPQIKEIVDRVPQTRMSAPSKDFALAYMSYTCQALNALIK